MSALNNVENNGESSNSKRSSLSVLSALDPKMKYLISHLEKNREKSRLSDSELKMLLTDVRSIGSRYADSDRVNQAMLYEAIDKVLNNLKNYYPYSSPFQKKVNQKEAPDYNEVIKNPMDLGTIAKKLKNRAYNSKEEFANDLYLIYTNCITYNTHPDNMFRKYAIVMKEKMDELLEAVPDVKVQTLAEYKASLKQDDGELFKVEKKSPSLDQLTESTSSVSLQVEDEPPGTDAGTDVQIAADLTGHSQASQENSSDEEEKEADREVQEMLKNIRLIPTLPLWDPEIDNPNRDNFFDSNYDPSANLPTLDQYPQLQFPKQGTSAMIEKNIETLKQSRILHAKLVSARHNIPLSHLGISEKPSEETPIINPIVDQKDLPPLILNKETGFACMQRVVSRLCQHAGFEATSNRALTILTEVAQDYFLNLSKTLRAYMDEYSKKMTPEEMINHALYENGVSSVKNLESYIHDDIQRYGTKLQDIKRRLEAALLQPEEIVDDIPDNDDAFLTGVFGEELHDDFFGFKELGLGPLQVPPQLILGSKRIKPLPKKASEHERQLPRHIPPPQWSPITDPESQIGLLKDFFRNKKNDSINDQIIEDENLPAKHRNQRPRVPPTGKIPPQPRRQLQKSIAQSAAALAEKKKKKERDAAIAKEKERIKLLKVEERERKKAEKNEQKRQKQLEKEAAKKAEAEAKEARKAEMEHQKRRAQEAKEAKKLEQEALKKADAEAKKAEPKKKKSTSSKIGKLAITPPQAEVSSSVASSTSSKKVHLLDIDSETVPIGQLKKRRTEITGSKPSNRPSPTAKKRVPHS
ncbi:saga complex subunit spt7 [Gigaspora margarita]|uniref:Saga complex subunit spt7 n=1 Tax=Gigaspora margarita TaxID=4874 RepID=A0A8H3X3C6_GIGMA|nr:saga complex subunit spt7 [Gigaspora margarita]